MEAALDARELTAAIDRFLDGLGYTDRYMFMRRYWYGDGVADRHVAAAVRFDPKGTYAPPERSAEALQDLDEVNVQLKVKGGPAYYYMTLNGRACALHEQAEEQLVSFTIPNSAK